MTSPPRFFLPEAAQRALRVTVVVRVRGIGSPSAPEDSGRTWHWHLTVAISEAAETWRFVEHVGSLACLASTRRSRTCQHGPKRRVLGDPSKSVVLTSVAAHTQRERRCEQMMTPER